jgi:protease-4
MSDDPNIPSVQPVNNPEEPSPPRSYYPRRSEPPPRTSGFRSVWNWLLRTVLIMSLVANFFFLMLWISSAGSQRLTESVYSGNAEADHRVAIVRIQGPILEGFEDYATKQLEQAAQDERVKAVVIAINSPGGSVTASDLLHKGIKDLRDGKWEKQKETKKVVVLMESIAASGGYYIAVPAQEILAQPTTITGSIGVYASFLDLSGVPGKYGIDMEIVKKGELKGQSMFRQMSIEDRMHWDNLLEHTYERFMAIVREGRGDRLKYGLRDVLPPAPEQVARFALEGAGLAAVPGPGGAAFLYGPPPPVRRLADGGVFHADQARAYGLIDRIGYLDDAIVVARQLAGLDEAQVITYNRPRTLMESLLGIESDPPQIDMKIENIPGATSRLWYLTPGHTLSGLRLPAASLLAPR